MAQGDNAAGQRRQIMLATGAAFAGAILLFLLWYFLLRTPFAPAFTGVNSADALTITQELDRLKTPYELANDGATILVPEDRVDEVRVNVLGSELPLKGAVGFELFNKSDMGLTEFAQKINYQRALQGELARTIMALDQIENARVHLSLPEEGIFEQDRRPAKASITVATKIGAQIDSNVVRGIQQLVAAAVPDLQAANVAILDARGQLLSPDISEFAPLAETVGQQRRQAYEQEMATKVEDAIRASGIAIPLKVKVTALRAFDNETEPTIVNAGEERGEDVAVADPPKRSDPVNVQLQLAVMPGTSIQQKLLIAAQKAVDYDPALGDVVSIQINPMVGTWQSYEPGTSTSRPAPSAAPKMADSTLWIESALWVIGLVMAALLAVAIVIFTIIRWRRRASPLDENQKEAFADRLKSLLDQEMTNDRQTA